MSDKENDEDEALWAYITKNIEPLKGKEAVKKDSGEKKSVKSEVKKDNAPRVFASSKADKKVAAPPQIDRRTAQKLERGQIKIESRLDLHGFSRDQARSELLNFLERSYIQGKRAVLVITGKGLRSAEREGENSNRLQKGVIRQELPRWLGEPKVKDIVLHYCTAKPKDGGSGAFYILLRRKRG